MALSLAEEKQTARLNETSLYLAARFSISQVKSDRFKILHFPVTQNTSRQRIS